ncbi:MAG: efflux RND transporter periplasmic adaptor subunit [Myxococcales bacterium]
MTRSSERLLRSSTGIVGVPYMNYRHYRSVLVAAGALCAALAFSFLPRGAVPAAAAKEIHAAAKYRCPMHTDVVQDHEGICPICNMKLVEVKPEPKNAQGAVAVPADKQSLLGIAVGSVERSAGSRTIRVPGRVTPDETRVYHINAGIDGSIRELPPITTGSRVHKDQILGGFYAPSAMSTMQIYLVNLSGYDRAVRQKEDGGQNEPISAVNLNLQQRLVQLENMGVSKLQREEMYKTRVVPDTIKIVSPADGFVLSRNITFGQKFDRGYEFFRIADLKRVWVMADVFAQDAGDVQPGMKAQISVPGRGKMTGTVTEVLPQFDSLSRTLKVRIAVENPKLVLRPDMFVDVQLSASMPEALTVPADAVVDSGVTQTVYVETAPGMFEARKVETGFRNGDRIEIASGLTEGQKIATSGAFFLDSETRMRAPVSGAAAQHAAVPVPTGHKEASSGGAGSHHMHGHDSQASAAEMQ